MTQVGKVFFLDTEIQGKRVKEVLEQPPSNHVVKFISQEEFERYSNPNNMMHKHVVKEMIRNMSGKPITLHYIKSAK